MGLEKNETIGGSEKNRQTISNWRMGLCQTLTIQIDIDALGKPETASSILWAFPNTGQGGVFIGK